MNTTVIRVWMMTLLCVVASHSYAKGPCDDIANVQQKQQCLRSEQQQAQQQTRLKAQQEAQRQAQLKAQQDQQRQEQAVARKKAQEDAQRQQQNAQQQAQQQTRLRAQQETPRQAQLKAQQEAPLKQSTAKQRTQPLPTAKGSVTGKLHKSSASGPTLDGVSVKSGGKSDTTGKNGKFKLDGIAAGSTTVAFSKSGYESYQGSINIAAGKTADMGERWLTEKTSPVPTQPPPNAKGSVSGKLHKNAASGPSLDGVTVKAGGRSATTSRDGKYKIDGIVAGNATISFSKAGYENYQGSVNIAAGKNADMGERWLSEKGGSKTASKLTAPIVARNIGKHFADSTYPKFFHTEHTGVDYMANPKTLVRAICGGKVYGNHTIKNIENAFLIVEHECPAPLNKVFGYYGHVTSGLKDHDLVKSGDPIANVRDQGDNSHLHFGLKANYVPAGWGRATLGTTKAAMIKAGWIDAEPIFR